MSAKNALSCLLVFVLAGCGGGDKPDIAYVPSDGRPHDSAADLPSAAIVNGSDSPQPSNWTLTQFANPTNRRYGKPALSSNGAVAVLGCDDVSLTANCLIFYAKQGDAALTPLPPVAGKIKTVNGKTVLLDESGNIIVNTEAGAFKSSMAGGAFVLVSGAQTTVFGVNASGNFVAKDGDTADLYISSISAPAVKAALPKLGSQRPSDAIGINTQGQIVGALEKLLNTSGPGFYIIKGNSLSALTSEALQYDQTSQPLGVVTALNDSGQVAGYYSLSKRSFVSKPDAVGVVGSIPESKASFSACCINTKGQLAGSSTFYTGGTGIDLKTTPAYKVAGLADLALSGLNDKLQLVGVATAAQGGERVVLFAGGA